MSGENEFYASVVRYGRSLLYIGYKNGKRIQTKIKYAPTLYVKAKGNQSQSGWTSMYGDPIDPVKFADMAEAKEFIKTYEDVNGFDIFGMEKFEYQFIIENYPKTVDYTLNQFNIQSLDIETEVPEDGSFPDVQSANVPITLISMQRKGTNIVRVWSLFEYTPTGKTDLFDCEIKFDHFSDEASLLRAFVQDWCADYPDIVTGWNSDCFDIPFLINRINRILGEDVMKKLSPWGMVREKKLEIRGNEVQVYELVGISQLDYMVLYKKYSFTPQESYALGHVASETIGVSKLEYEGSFRDFYMNEPSLFVEYNIRDVQLVDRMDAKFKFIELIIQIAYMAKCNIQDVFGSVKTWDVFIYSFLHAKKVAIPASRRSTDVSSIEGAYVKEALTGMMRWVVSFDATSLYPETIKAWNISPETKLVGMHDLGVLKCLENGDFLKEISAHAKEHNYSFSANGARFSRDTIGILPQLMTVCLAGRKGAKKEMLGLQQIYNDTKDESLPAKIAALDGRQMALKILANSLYGAAGNKGFRYFDPSIAEAITLAGQWSNRTVMKVVNDYLNKILGTDADYIITGDTDSIYINFGPFVDKFFPGKTDDETVDFLLKILPKITKVIDAAIKSVYETSNGVQETISYKLECVASKGFWTAKKHYALKVHNSEGVTYNPPKIKVMGLDLIKVSTPSAIRGLLKGALPVMFDKDEEATQKYIADCKSKFMNMSPEEIAFPRGVSDIEKWVDSRTMFKSRCPIHVRAAIVHNNATEKVRDMYPKIASGDKLRFIYLVMPNPVKQDVIAFPATGKFPRSLGLDRYVDKEKQWEKTFMNPMSGLTTSIGWDAEETSSLEDFFG